MNRAKETISNMKECEIEYFWCDNMYFDGDCAWFIGSNINALFCLSYLTGQIEFVATMPDSNIKKFREYRVLYKSRKYVFCFPDNGGRLLLYDISSKRWIEKEINNPDHARIGIEKAYEVEGIVYAVASGISMIIEVTVHSDCKISMNYFPMGITSNDMFDSVYADGIIYYVHDKENVIYAFNIKSKEIKKLPVPNVDNKENGFATICYGRNRFWLSGTEKKIYIWNENNNTTDIIDDFPEEFGVYKLDRDNKLLLDTKKEEFECNIFYKSIDQETAVWFIPYRSNFIVYIDKADYSINVFDVPNEQEDDNSWNRWMDQKFVIMYSREENNLVGLYSFKNKSVFEVDLATKNIRSLSYVMNEQDRNKMWVLFVDEDKVIIEKAGYLDFYFQNLEAINEHTPVNEDQTIGDKILDYIKV